MFLEVFTHQYFWLSFFPISFLGIGFWFLFMERGRKQKDSLFIFVIALVFGIVSALVFSFFQSFFVQQNLFINVIGEEVLKCFFALFAMEIFKKKFKTLAGGIVYGFSIGIGFALAENIVYLALQFNRTEFSPDFWLLFQGRFWSSTLLHGVTTALFGLFYAGAYLSKTLYKGKHESPFKGFFQFPSLKQAKYLITLHVTREHLLLQQKMTLKGHSSRAIILEGVWLAILVHYAFNLSLEYSHTTLAFGIAIFMMFFLKNKIKTLSE